jgi:hypothetical protein
MAEVTTAVAAPVRMPFAVLLDRRGVVYLAPAPATPAGSVPDPLVAAGVTLLEADLLERGLLMSVPLRRRLEQSDPATLTDLGTRLLGELDAGVRSDRTWVPLFRGFPDTTPQDTLALWVDRVLAVLAQDPDQPCVLCGREGTVLAVSPCAHLVCRSCFDGADYTACPICYRALEPDDEFLLPRPATGELLERPLPDELRLVGLGEDILADAHAVVADLLARPAALSPQDRDDLVALLETHDRTDLSWLPDIPGRETQAIVLDWLLRSPEHWATTLPEVGRRLGTATDALRLLSTRGGGDPGLVRATRFAPVPRALRRTVLAALDKLDPRTLIEDLRRHERQWLRAAERLHPFEHAAQYPVAAAGFAALRRTRSLDRRLTRAVNRAGLTVVDGRVTVGGFWTLVEALLAHGEVAAAADLLTTRPGEFVRRLAALITRDPAAGEALLAALPDAARRVAPAVLLAALGALRIRKDGAAAPARAVFPKGPDAKAHLMPEERPALPVDIVDRACAVLVDEVLARCAALAPVDVALVDARLSQLAAPFTQRTTSRALVTLPRGSRVELPPTAQRVRLFLHWMQSTVRVDLDLSVAIFDAQWQHIGTCDYTSLRWKKTAAVHSGDRTDAPAPAGASEFLDLDLDRLARKDARYLVVCVFSYNDVAFEDMAEAFAGFMELPAVATSDGTPVAPAGDGPAFQPRAVRQRFDLGGRARAVVPFVLDVADRSVRWLDVARGVTGTDHAVHRHLDALALLGWGLTGYYASAARVRLGEVALWHAAARARTVLLRGEDGEITAFARHGGETVQAFAARIASGAAPDPVDAAPPALAFLYRGDAAVAPGAEVYALDRADLDPGAVTLLAAEDLVASLAVAESAEGSADDSAGELTIPEQRVQ